mmetsp:Transcript_105222/g.280111  ORF Transcript_105222/g.280111 Transcript_105222/m.280111 type:complete len:285 (+) Transcript_105222:290-1144(+)
MTCADGDCHAYGLPLAERNLARHHFVQQDAAGEDVCRLRILVGLQDLRCHVAPRAGALRHPGSDRTSQAKITEFDWWQLLDRKGDWGGEEGVRGLDVAVDNPLLVKVFNSGDNVHHSTSTRLPAEAREAAVLRRRAVQQVGEGPAGAEIQDQRIGRAFQYAMAPDKVRVVQLRRELRLSLLALDGPLVEHLHGDLQLRVLHSAADDLAKRSSPKDFMNGLDLRPTSKHRLCVSGWGFRKRKSSTHEHGVHLPDVQVGTWLASRTDLLHETRFKAAFGGHRSSSR